MIERSKSEQKRAALTQSNVELSKSWERIQKAHDSTTISTELRDAGLLFDFWSVALSDITAVMEIAAQERERIAVFLIRELNISSRTVSGITNVSHGTVAKWVNEAEGRDNSV